METNEHNSHFEAYRRVPMNSATTRIGSTGFNSIGTHSTFSSWSKLRTTYIDGTTICKQYNRSYNMKDFFPKGKGRQKPVHSSEKKDTRAAYMSSLPGDAVTVRSEKTRSLLPEVISKKANIRSQHSPRTMILTNDSQSKFSPRCATTNVSGSWVRRYKSINESQILSDFLRDPSYENKTTVLKKRSHQEFFLSSSSSSSFKSFSKRRREKC